MTNAFHLREIDPTSEQWFRSLALQSGATWTSSTNVKLHRLYAKHGYVQVAASPHDSTGSPMVKLEKRYLA
jgi:hypothetical protein